MTRGGGKKGGTFQQQQKSQAVNDSSNFPAGSCIIVSIRPRSLMRTTRHTAELIIIVSVAVAWCVSVCRLVELIKKITRKNYVHNVTLSNKIAAILQASLSGTAPPLKEEGCSKPLPVCTIRVCTTACSINRGRNFLQVSIKPQRKSCLPSTSWK